MQPCQIGTAYKIHSTARDGRAPNQNFCVQFQVMPFSAKDRKKATGTVNEDGRLAIDTAVVRILKAQLSLSRSTVRFLTYLFTH